MDVDNLMLEATADCYVECLFGSRAVQVHFLFCILGIFPMFKDCLMSLLLCPFFFSFSFLGQCFLKVFPWNPDAWGFVKYLQKHGHFVCFCSYFS
jgi:hypothetical protein